MKKLEERAKYDELAYDDSGQYSRRLMSELIQGLKSVYLLRGFISTETQSDELVQVINAVQRHLGQSLHTKKEWNYYELEQWTWSVF